MYPSSIRQWNPFVGCRFNCIYCRRSFQAQLKRQKHRCISCYNYEPHEHPERLAQSLPITSYGQFIFTCANGDISFCSTAYLNKIVGRIHSEPDKTFLIQSKNPITFHRIKWPDNVILGTTLETDTYDGYDVGMKISDAPDPAIRLSDFCYIQHPLKMITIEPVIDFNMKAMVLMMEQIKPCIIWIGYDTKKAGLPEPPIEKVKELYWELGRAGFAVMLKKI